MLGTTATSKSRHQRAHVGAEPGEGDVLGDAQGGGQPAALVQVVGLEVLGRVADDDEVASARSDLRSSVRASLAASNIST